MPVNIKTDMAKYYEILAYVIPTIKKKYIYIYIYMHYEPGTDPSEKFLPSKLEHGEKIHCADRKHVGFTVKCEECIASLVFYILKRKLNERNRRECSE